MTDADLTDLLAQAKQAKQDWIMQFAKGEEVKNYIHSLLDQRLAQVVFKFLNLEQIMSENKYSGSPIVIYLRTYTENAVKQWLDAKAGNLKATLSEADVVEIKKVFDKCYMEKLRSEVIALAQAKAKEDAQKLVENI